MTCRYGAQGLTLSKIVPHICHLLGDPTSQVRDHVTVQVCGCVMLWSRAPSAGETRNCVQMPSSQCTDAFTFIYRSKCMYI